MIKTVDIYEFLNDAIAYGRKHSEANKEKHDKERWKQLALGNHEEAMAQASLLCGDIGVLETYNLFENFIKYFQDHADTNGLLTYEFNEKDFTFTTEKNEKQN